MKFNREHILSLSKHKAVKHIVFFVILLFFSGIYKYHETISYRPISKHQWRSCISASQALNYYHEGEFLHPRTHHTQADHYTSDITPVEFPGYYYFISILYTIFGFNELIYRLVNILIGFIGLYYLFLLGLRLFKNTFFSFIPPLILFTSPIYIYYLNNFITDSISISLVLIGLYYFYLFFENSKDRFLLLSMIILAIAGLIKTPALLLYFAFGSIFIFEIIFKQKYKAGRIFNRWYTQVLYFAGVIIIIAAWYTYAKMYHDQHGGMVSNVEIRPIWILSQADIGSVWKGMKAMFWNNQYHSSILLIISLLLIIYNVIFWNKFNKLFSSLTLLTFVGGIAYSILFFRSLGIHDYYQINNLIILILLSINYILYLREHRQKIYRSWITKMILSIAILAFAYNYHSLHKRNYYGWFLKETRSKINNIYDDITPYLRSLGIEREDLVYCTFDNSINITLYLADQKGFTDFGRDNKTFEENVKELRQYGLQYVILNDSSRLNMDPALIGLEKIGAHHGAMIFAVHE